MNDYQVVIGLEIHVELSTKTKIFCGCKTDFGCPPNTSLCPVCMGMPGTLPVLNKEVVNKAMAVGLALGCDITRETKFDRKNYFYPDNPQNYQISQLYFPICTNGCVEISTDDKNIGEGQDKKKIRIREIHMEEDAGKLIHDQLEGKTLIDYNRAGVPLIEIVTQPDMNCYEEVLGFLEKLRLIIQYLGASDCKLNEGSMRVDVNLSVNKMGNNVLGTRTEMKNLNSFRAIKRAIDNEAKRQIEVIEAGGVVLQETRRWDDVKGESYSMRSKEDAQDYRYFPEPDLPRVVIDEKWIKDVKGRLPELREEKSLRYKMEYDLPDYDIEIITGSKVFADLFESVVKCGSDPKKVSNWLMTETLRLMKEFNMEPENLRFSPEHLAGLIELVDKKIITGTTAKEIFSKIFIENIEPKEYVKEKNLGIITDNDALRKVVLGVIENNPKSVEDYKNGKHKAIGYLVGQTMAVMKGQADAGEINRILQGLLPK